jgi:hypothetical protein
LKACIIARDIVVLPTPLVVPAIISSGLRVTKEFLINIGQPIFIILVLN